jgi:hypothetical protein
MVTGAPALALEVGQDSSSLPLDGLDLKLGAAHCIQRLRNAFYHWARTSIQRDPRSKHHYARLRQLGHDHGRALRGVALIACSLCSSQCLRVDKPMIQSDVPPPTLRPPERISLSLVYC